MKKFITIVTVIIMLLSLSMISYAEDSDEMTVAFDMNIDGVQTAHTMDADGNEYTVTMTKIPDYTRGSTSMGYGSSSWVIEWKSITSSVEYKLDAYVSGNGIGTITRVYDGYYGISIYEVVSSDLRINRATETSALSAQAEYYFEGKLFTGGYSTNGWVRADIKNMVITSSYK